MNRKTISGIKTALRRTGLLDGRAILPLNAPPAPPIVPPSPQTVPLSPQNAPVVPSSPQSVPAGSGGQGTPGTANMIANVHASAPIGAVNRPGQGMPGMPSTPLPPAATPVTPPPQPPPAPQPLPSQGTPAAQQGTMRIVKETGGGLGDDQLIGDMVAKEMQLAASPIFKKVVMNPKMFLYYDYAVSSLGYKRDMGARTCSPSCGPYSPTTPDRTRVPRAGK